jgi:hypothetical protein
MYAVRQLRLAAGTGAGRNSRHPVSVTQRREPTDPQPVTRHAKRRKLREARSLPSFLGQRFAKLGNPENVRGQKKRVPVHVWCLADIYNVCPTAHPQLMSEGFCAERSH